MGLCGPRTSRITLHPGPESLSVSVTRDTCPSHIPIWLFGGGSVAPTWGYLHNIIRWKWTLYQYIAGHSINVRISPQNMTTSRASHFLQNTNHRQIAGAIPDSRQTPWAERGCDPSVEVLWHLPEDQVGGIGSLFTLPDIVIWHIVMTRSGDPLTRDGGSPWWWLCHVTRGWRYSSTMASPWGLILILSEIIRISSLPETQLAPILASQWWGLLGLRQMWHLLNLQTLKIIHRGRRIQRARGWRTQDRCVKMKYNLHFC